MTMPVPAAAPAAAPSPSSPPSPYIHAEWLEDYADIINNDLVLLWTKLRVMEMCLAEQQAGRTQLRLVRGCLASAAEILMFVVTFVDRTDKRFAPVFEAIDVAGGLDEVAKVKAYHDSAA